MDKAGQISKKQASILSFFHPKSQQPPPPSSPPVIKHSQEDLEPEKEAPVASEESEQIFQTTPGLALNEEQPDLFPKAVVSAINENHIQPLKRINTLLLPINYPDNFYHNILSPDRSADLSFVILWNSPKQSPPRNSKVYTVRKEPQQVVGGIVCRLEQYPKLGTSAVYIQSLALLSPYRSQGLAAALLDTVIRAIVQLPSSINPIPHCLYAHVWTENTEGLAWYKSRGFVIQPPPIENYYSRLRPSTAFIVSRNINPSDYIRHKSSNTTSTSSSKHSSEDWEIVESPTMVSTSAPPTLPFVATPPTMTSLEAPQKQSKKSSKPAQTYLNFPPAPTPAVVTPPTSIPNLPNPPIPSIAAKPLNPHLSRPSLVHTESFQNRAPPSEWNDLPLDILGASAKNPLSRSNSALDADAVAAASAPGSRSSSSSRTSGKKKRLYPAAAFGGAGA